MKASNIPYILGFIALSLAFTAGAVPWGLLPAILLPAILMAAAGGLLLWAILCAQSEAYHEGQQDGFGDDDAT